MRTRLIGVLGAVLIAWPVAAETVRVVVARGDVLEVETGASALRLESVGPFVSTGDRLLAALDLFHPQGARVAGRTLLGRGEVLAEETQLVAVDEVDLETYVASVVGAEMPASWPEAALEAQAIAVRTYALGRKARAGADAPFHLEATVAHQVYGGAASLDPRTRAAAEATKGLVLTYEGALAEAYFFSACTGRTESAQAAFGRGAPYLVPVPCDGGEASPKAKWVERIPARELSKKLNDAGVLGDELRRIEVVSRTSTGRVARARLKTRRGERTISGAELRQLIGWRALPSLEMSVRERGGQLVFEGSGSGHGVGLCQWCAKGQAAGGKDARAILSHFYPGTSVELR